MMRAPGKKIGLAFLFLIAILLTTMHSCMTFRMSSTEIDQYFQQKKVQASQHRYQSGFRQINYVVAGDEGKPVVVFIHGSPGSLSAFIHFLADTALLQRALLVTTDRPGFGYSNFGNAEPSLSKQAALLKPILQKYKNDKPLILVGHSLGGPLIGRMAIDYPELVDGLIIVAGSIDPDLEPDEAWFRAPLSTPFLSWILPRSFRASNEEIYQLKPQLYEMMPEWSKITCPVIVIQGDKDQLVPRANADFARKMITNAPVELVRVADMNHFVPWSNPELIRNAVLQLIVSDKYSSTTK
jgi:pimeloyl-ACP methyl ester carboxylesterase